MFKPSGSSRLRSDTAVLSVRIPNPMPETFLILVAGGVMLSAAVSDPRAVILRWLRLAGIIAFSMAALAAFFGVRRGVSPIGGWFLGATFVAILAQLAFVQVAWRNTQRVFCLGA